jgi:type IV pilus assembly protein PilC
MKFLYTAKTQKGEIQTGVIEAGSREAAISTLQGFGLVVLEINEQKRRSFFEDIFAGFRRVSLRDLSIFTRQLSVLLQAELPLVEALRTMFRQTQNVFLKEAIFDVVSEVEAGTPPSQAFSRHKEVFSEFFVQMVRSAEITGRLQEVFEYLAKYLDSQLSIAYKVRGALVYPIFVISLFVLVLSVMLIFVIPQLKLVFQDSGVEISTLPLLTRILFGLGDNLRLYAPSLVVALIIFIIGTKSYINTQEGKILWDAFKLKIPIFGEIMQKIYISRFSQTTSVMIKGDIPIAQALEISADVVGNEQYRFIILEAAEAVRRGELLSEAISKYEVEFPPLVSQMIAIGEKTGRLDELTDRISEFYMREVDQTLSNLTELLQPSLIVVLGLFVGLLMASVLLPIQQLATRIGG